MGKKKHRPGPKAGSVPRHVGDEFHAVERPMRDRRRIGADMVLDPFTPHRGGAADILEALLDVHVETDNFRGVQETCERLIELRPNDPDLTLVLAGAYMANIRPVLALQTFRRFLERWPDHEEAPEARATVAELEPEVEVMVEELGLSGDDALELAALHERTASLLDQGHFAKARQGLDRLLRRHPDFAPGLNNLGQIYALEGRLDQAIEMSRRVLASDPDNVHALSNLTRYLVLSGRPEDAAQEAERLKKVESEQPDRWLKEAEALSYLGDDRGVLDALEAAEKERAELRIGDPMLYHLGGVAAMRLGQEKEARRYWKKALELAPGLEVAEDNLEDLENQVGERHAPWPFDFANWVTYLGIVGLLEEAERVLETGDESALSRSFERYLHRHPEIVGIIPRLLDAGDPTGREFALRTAMTANTPEMLAALKDFALGQRGPDTLRMEAAQVVLEAGLLPSDRVRFWQGGEWREVRLVSYDLHDEPLSSTVLARHLGRI